KAFPFTDVKQRVTTTRKMLSLLLWRSFCICLFPVCVTGCNICAIEPGEVNPEDYAGIAGTKEMDNKLQGAPLRNYIADTHDCYKGCSWLVELNTGKGGEEIELSGSIQNIFPNTYHSFGGTAVTVFFICVGHNYRHSR